MVHFEITPRIRTSLLRVLKDENKLAKNDLLNFQKYSSDEEKSIPFAVVVKLADYLQKLPSGDDSPSNSKKKKIDIKYFHELVEGSKEVNPTEKDFTGLTEEQIQKEKYRQKLQEDAANREYKKMTKSLRHDEKAVEKFQAGRELKHVNDVFKIGLNFVVSAITMFAVGYFLFDRAFGGKTAGVLGGLFLGVGIVVVEMTLFILRTNQVDKLFVKQDKKEEKLSLSIDHPSSRRNIVVQENYSTHNKSKED